MPRGIPAKRLAFLMLFVPLAPAHRKLGPGPLSGALTSDAGLDRIRFPNATWCHWTVPENGPDAAAHDRHRSPWISDPSAGLACFPGDSPLGGALEPDPQVTACVKPRAVKSKNGREATEPPNPHSNALQSGIMAA